MIKIVFKIEKIIKIAQDCKVISIYVLVVYYTIMLYAYNGFTIVTYIFIIFIIF
jgi:hypothetical protein